MEDIRVRNDYAIRCSIVSKPVNVIEYVKAVSALVGASHILAVFEESDSVKIFFNDKRFVDTLMRSCLHVMGYHVRLDYASPPGTRLVLTDIDPIIPNYDVLRLLSQYGSVVSPIIRPPVSDDIELCHIGYGVRYVYMNLTTEHLPEHIEFKSGEKMFCFKIHIETADVMTLASIKMDTFDDSHLENENSNSSIFSQDVSSPPVLVSVQSVNSNNGDEEQATPQLLPSDISQSAMNSVPHVQKRRGRPPNRFKRLQIAKTVTSTSKAARKIKRNVKHKWIRRRYRKGKVGGKQMINAISLAKRTVHKPSNSSSCSSTFINISPLQGQGKEENDDCDVDSEKQRLLEFLTEVKHQRAPLELAKKYFGDDCNSINKLVEKLTTFKQQQVDLSLKTRIWRLVKSLKDSLNNSYQSISPGLID